jgi:hypothetical protein
MNHEEKERFIIAWIAGAEAEFDTPQREGNHWALSLLDELTDKSGSEEKDDRAEQAWELILAINERSLSDDALAYLAAGPLEELLSYHGEAFIERVEERAKTDPKFNHLLGGVWQLFMTDAIWERVQAARDEVW